MEMLAASNLVITRYLSRKPEIFRALLVSFRALCGD